MKLEKELATSEEINRDIDRILREEQYGIGIIGKIRKAYNFFRENYCSGGDEYTI